MQAAIEEREVRARLVVPRLFGLVTEVAQVGFVGYDAIHRFCNAGDCALLHCVGHARFAVDVVDAVVLYLEHHLSAQQLLREVGVSLNVVTARTAALGGGCIDVAARAVFPETILQGEFRQQLPIVVFQRPGELRQ